MKALLYKDFYMIGKYAKSTALFILVFLTVSIFQDGAFYSTYPVIVGSMLPISLMSYDEKFKWNIYAEALPFSRKNIISSKYIMILIIVAVIIMASIVTNFISMIINNVFSMETLKTTIITIAVIGIMAPSFMFPLIFKLGVEKARMIYLIIVGALTAIMLNFESKGGTGLSFLNNIPELYLLIGMVIVFIISWLLSIKIYEKKEI